MRIRHVWGVVGATLLSSTFVLAQSSGQTTASSGAQADAGRGTPITLVGCLQREADYRKQNDSGRGGPVATGAGLGNEYVLVNAADAGAARGAMDCSSASGGTAYELTGEHERDLTAFVGRRVEITGMLKAGTGGFDPLGQDLRIQEVEVMSSREASAAAPALASNEPAEPLALEPRPIGTSGSAAEEQQPVASNELPRTAGPLPLAGLLGLLSLGGALGVRALRRR